VGAGASLAADGALCAGGEEAPQAVKTNTNKDEHAALQVCMPETVLRTERRHNDGERPQAISAWINPVASGSPKSSTGLPSAFLTPQAAAIVLSA
jgi:hypothetical protein